MERGGMETANVIGQGTLGRNETRWGRMEKSGQQRYSMEEDVTR